MGISSGSLALTGGSSPFWAWEDPSWCPPDAGCRWWELYSKRTPCQLPPHPPLDLATLNTIFKSTLTSNSGCTGLLKADSMGPKPHSSLTWPSPCDHPLWGSLARGLLPATRDFPQTSCIHTWADSSAATQVISSSLTCLFLGASPGWRGLLSPAPGRCRHQGVG